MTRAHKDEQPERLTEQRRDDALRRALNTPPKPHDEMKLGKGKAKKPNASASSKKA